MSMLLHDQGIAYVVMPYRERFEAKSARELSYQLKSLSKQFGHYIALTKVGENTYDAVLSHLSGVLLAEQLRDTLPNAASFIYLESLGDDNCLLVVVENHQILADTCVSRPQLLEHVLPYWRQLMGCDLFWVQGVSWTQDELSALDREEGLMRKLWSSPWRGQMVKHPLLALSDVVSSYYKPWYKATWFYLSLAAVLAVSFSAGIYSIESRVKPVFHAVDHAHMIDVLAEEVPASDVLAALSSTLIRLQAWPGVSVTQISLNKNHLKVSVLLKEHLRRRAWNAWLAEHGFNRAMIGDQEQLQRQLSLQGNAEKPSLLSVDTVFDKVADAAELSLGEADLLERSRERQGPYEVVHATLRVKGMSAARLSLLADSIRRHPVVLRRVSLHNRDHHFWGTLHVTLWGYVS